MLASSVFYSIGGNMKKLYVVIVAVLAHLMFISSASAQPTNDIQIHPLLVEPAEIGSRREKIEREVTYLRRVKSSLCTVSHS